MFPEKDEWQTPASSSVAESQMCSTQHKEKTSLVQRITCQSEAKQTRIYKISLGFTSERRKIQSWCRFLNKLGPPFSINPFLRSFSWKLGISEIRYSDLKQTLKLRKFHVAWGYKHLKELLKQLQLSNEVSTDFFSQRICLPKSHMQHTSCQIAAETSARRECSQLPIPTIDKKRIRILLPLSSTAVELTEIFLSSTLQSERKVNSQIPVSPHPLSDFLKIHCYILQTKAIHERVFHSQISEGSVLKFPFPNVTHSS